MSKVRFETSDALGLITLANPPLNLFDQELIDDLRTAVGAARKHPLRALLVRADGKNFSGGADVAIFKGKTAKEARERFTSHLRTIADLEELPFPTIVAVQGACMAAGLELALACDLIWAASSARFGQVEASIGTTTLLGGVQRLAERAGPSRAREIIYTADQYDAATSSDGTSLTESFLTKNLSRRPEPLPSDSPAAQRSPTQPARKSYGHIWREASAPPTRWSTRSLLSYLRPLTCAPVSMG